MGDVSGGHKEGGLAVQCGQNKYSGILAGTNPSQAKKLRKLEWGIQHQSSNT